MDFVFLVPKKFDLWSKNVIAGHFRLISGEIFAEKIFLGQILLHQKICLWISVGVSSAFLSYRAYIRRYLHFRRFWQFTANSYRDC